MPSREASRSRSATTLAPVSTRKSMRRPSIEPSTSVVPAPVALHRHGAVVGLLLGRRGVGALDLRLPSRDPCRHRSSRAVSRQRARGGRTQRTGSASSDTCADSPASSHSKGDHLANGAARAGALGGGGEDGVGEIQIKFTTSSRGARAARVPKRWPLRRAELTRRAHRFDGAASRPGKCPSAEPFHFCPVHPVAGNPRGRG